MDFKELVSAVRIDNELNKTELAEGLNRYLPVEEQMSPMAVTHWERGAWKPRTTLLFFVYNFAPVGSWQHDFALRGMELRGFSVVKTNELITAH